MLEVLVGEGFRADIALGASVGAINAAAYAGDPTPSGMSRLVGVWRELRAETVFPHGLVHGRWQFLQQRDAVHGSEGLRQVIERSLGYVRLEDAAIPVQVVATSREGGDERWLSAGPAVEALLASAALPGIFPPGVVEGEALIDGGVLNDVPLSRAIELGATRIVVLLCGPLDHAPVSLQRPLDAVLAAFGLALRARFDRELRSLPAGVEVAVVAPDAFQPHGYWDFSHTEELIQVGRAHARAVVAALQGAPPEPGPDGLARITVAGCPAATPAAPDELPVGA